MPPNTKNFNPISFAKGVLRRASHKCPAHWGAIKEAGTYYTKKNKDGSVSKRKFIKFRCAQCRKFFQKKEVEVDHIEPIGAYKDDLTEWVVALFCGERQVLCKPCHKKKSKKDKKVLKEMEKENGKQNYRRIHKN
jgi:hypothetical protein